MRDHVRIPDTVGSNKKETTRRTSTLSTCHVPCLVLLLFLSCNVSWEVLIHVDNLLMFPCKMMRVIQKAWKEMMGKVFKFSCQSTWQVFLSGKRDTERQHIPLVSLKSNSRATQEELEEQLKEEKEEWPMKKEIFLAIHSLVVLLSLIFFKTLDLALKKEDNKVLGVRINQCISTV